MDVFFDTEEAHTVVLALGADRGGRATPQGLPGSPPMDILKETARLELAETCARLDHREQAGSDPVTFFGAKKTSISYEAKSIGA